MFQNCTINLLRDVEETVPGLSVNIAEIIATHQVVSTGDTTPYSKEDDVNQIGRYVSDKIDAAISVLGLEKKAAAGAAVKPAASSATAEQ